MWKSVAQSLARRLGYEVRRQPISPETSALAPPSAFDQQRRLLAGMGVPAPIIFDVGANRGQTVDAYRAQFPQARIVCFEPFPDLVTTLRGTFRNDPHITVVPYAVSERAGLCTFHVTGRDDQNSLLPRPRTRRRYFPADAHPTHAIEVPSITLDDVVESGLAPAPDILKFDVQGAELMALRGATRLLASGRVHLIYVEVWFVPQYEGAPLFPDVWTFLEGFGYSVYAVHDLHTASNGQLRIADAIFVSDALRSRVLDAFPEEA